MSFDSYLTDPDIYDPARDIAFLTPVLRSAFIIDIDVEWPARLTRLMPSKPNNKLSPVQKRK